MYRVSCLLVFAVTGCGIFFQKNKLPYTRNDEYAAYDFKDQKVFVAPIFRENVYVSNVEDAADDLGEPQLSANELVVKYYLPIFLDSLKQGIKDKEVVILSDSLVDKYEAWAGLESQEVELEVGDDRVRTRFRIPTPTALKKFGFDEDILILVEQLAFNRNSVRMGKGGEDIPITPRLKYSYEYDYLETKESASLGVKAKVLIWNYKKNEGILYGTVAEKTVFRMVMQKKHWDKSAASLSKKIVQVAKYL